MPQEKKTVCFACATEYHLLITYILSTTVYSKDRKILFLLNDSRLIGYFNVVREINLWDEVICIDQVIDEASIDRRYREWVLLIDIMHYFTVGFLPYNILFSKFQELGKTIILTDEGIGSYLPFKRFGDWINKNDPERIITKNVDLRKVSEIWLINPELFSDQNIIPTKKIDLDEFIARCREDDQIVQDYKKLFNIPNVFSFSYDIIYFRQYYSLVGDLPIEIDGLLDQFICGLLSNFRTVAKNHPAYINEYYAQDIDHFTIDTPWEALLILKQIDKSASIDLPKMYISARSTAMFTTNTLGFAGDFIFLNKIFERYMYNKDGTINYLIDAARSVFPKSHFIEPESFIEFYNNILGFIPNQHYHLDSFEISPEEFIRSENELLTKMYLSLLTERQEHYRKDNERDQMIQTLSNRLLDCENEKISYIMSTSWRLTRPLRAIKNIVMRKNK